MHPAKNFIDYEIVKKYEITPSPMDNLGKFIYYRSYSRWDENRNRMERWHETVKRAVEYNCSLEKTEPREAVMLFKNICEMKQFIAGRTLWIGGTKMSSVSPMANYNCSFIILDDMDCFCEIFYLLMLGCGVGVRVLPEDASKLPPLRSNFEIVHKPYKPIPALSRISNTSLDFPGENIAVIKVGDSREGWSNALDILLKLLHKNEYKSISRIVFNYDNVRQKGERLKTFGGFASGHESLLKMISKLCTVVKKRSGLNIVQKLETIDLLDIVNIIGENVSAGGVRRSAEMIIFESGDSKCMKSKLDIFSPTPNGPVLKKGLSHRTISNNSVYYSSKPSRSQLKEHVSMIMKNGEPGILNAQAAAKRNPQFKGVNPCAEVLLTSRGICNLTTVNLPAFVKNGTLDMPSLETAQKLSVRAAVRMNSVDLELYRWNNVNKDLPSIGCSLTGWFDMVSLTHMDRSNQSILLNRLRYVAQKEALEYSASLKKKSPKLVTTIKPEGSLSQMAGASQGAHYPPCPYYLRRIRTTAGSPISKLYFENGYNVVPEKSKNLDVIEFPVKSLSKYTLQNASALDQLENYKMFMNNYVDHNCSITINVKKNEWFEVSEWIFDNWDSVVAITLMPHGCATYPLMPIEAISQSQYSKISSNIKPISESDIEKSVGNMFYECIPCCE